MLFFDLSDRYWDICRKHCLGTSWMGWRPVEWVGDQLTGWVKSCQEQNLKINGHCFFDFFYFSDWYWNICKKHFWEPVEWVGDQLTGWRKSCQKQNWKLNGYCFLFFFILATNTEISVWNTFGDQLNGFGTSLMGWGPIDWVRKVLREATFKNKWILFFEFFIFFYFSDRYWDICKKHFWGPVEWVWDQLTGWGKSCQKQN